jgi:hypothetical protein
MGNRAVPVVCTHELIPKQQISRLLMESNNELSSSKEDSRNKVSSRRSRLKRRLQECRTSEENTRLSQELKQLQLVNRRLQSDVETLHLRVQSLQDQLRDERQMNPVVNSEMSGQQPPAAVPPSHGLPIDDLACVALGRRVPSNTPGMTGPVLDNMSDGSDGRGAPFLVSISPEVHHESSSSVSLATHSAERFLRGSQSPDSTPKRAR